MTREGTVARRYAKALLLLVPVEAREGVAEELGRVKDLLDGHPELYESLTRPWVKGSDKRAILSVIVEREGASPLVRNFVCLLAGKNRIGVFQEILAQYQALVDLEAGRVRAEVRVAFPLRAEERSRLARGLGRALGKVVVLDELVEPGLIAGFRAQIGSLVLDASLKGQIESMQETLTVRS